MEIRLARSMGFCFGVKRAVSIAQQAAMERGTITTLGPLVHNDQMVGRLQDEGVQMARDLAEVGSCPVVISAHGVERCKYEEASERSIEVIDATCPIVRQIQKKAKDLSEAGYFVVILGDARHSEVRGVLGWTNGKARVVGPGDDLADLPSARKVAVLGQSTLISTAFDDLLCRLITACMSHIQELVVHNTLCNATSSAQASALELAEEVGTIIVVGGRSSANTRHLAEVCAGTGVATHHIEKADEIRLEWFDGISIVGITAGASTPDWIVDEVVARIEQIGEQLDRRGRGPGAS